MIATKLAHSPAAGKGPGKPTGSGPLTRWSYTADNCLICSFPLPATGLEGFCEACAGGEPVFGANFRTEAEARISWALYCLVLYGELRPFPGDRPPRPAAPRPGGRRGSIFEELRQVDLAAWAGQYTELRQVSPGRWKGRCPVHQERTASFYVFQDDKRWWCFGACATGGDIVTLAAELRRIGRW